MSWFRSLIERFFGNKKEYTLIDTFGCTECPPQDCPTFLERDVHQQFVDALASYNIIVVYGESRQGKTWTIERYCPEQLRIGCNATMEIYDIKIEMLHAVNTVVREVEHSISEQVAQDSTFSSDFGTPAFMQGSTGCTNSTSRTETFKTTYTTIDLAKTSEFIQVIKEKANGRYFVFDNFHYLPPAVQQHFCALLKEFNYQGIKVIIVGVWKDASRITALAPDLVNRCQHIDIGSWSKNELDEVVHKGELALNIEIDDEAKNLFEGCAANNIGIMKDFLQKYCQKFKVGKTQEKKRLLADSDIAREVADAVINEAYAPLRDRSINLALPHRERSGSKHLRQKIVISVFQLVLENDVDFLQNGLPLSLISAKMDELCDELQDEKMDISHITQELGLLHQREENRQTKTNFIPLFYFDKANKKLLVLEPTIYMIKAYNQCLLEDIVLELKERLEKKKSSV